MFDRPQKMLTHSAALHKLIQDIILSNFKDRVRVKMNPELSLTTEYGEEIVWSPSMSFCMTALHLAGGRRITISGDTISCICEGRTVTIDQDELFESLRGKFPSFFELRGKPSLFGDDAILSFENRHNEVTVQMFIELCHTYKKILKSSSDLIMKPVSDEILKYFGI